MRKPPLLTLTTLTASVLACSTLNALNVTYNAGGTDPQNWNDIANFGGAQVDTGGNVFFIGTDGSGVNALNVAYTVVPGQLQVGRGASTTVEITTGGVLTNTNQTVVGILSNGIGTLNITGGTLVTPSLRFGINAGGTAAAGSSATITSGVLDISNNIELGTNAAATFNLNGGTVTADTGISIKNGSTLNINGAAGSLDFGSGLFDFSNGTHLNFNTVGGTASTIYAGTFNLGGTGITLGIDGVASNLTLISLASGVFSEQNLIDLNNALNLTGGAAGTLSLANGGSDLMFAVPEPSTYALLGGLFALGFVALRRRS
ncbi:PEP-CTERM sorting domain-containing protein [Coraliomargarita sp. W4R53]